MASRLDIVNGALNGLGELSVSNAKNTDHAKLIDEKIDLAYERTLTDDNWTFPQKFVTLVRTTAPGIPNLPYPYQLPFDLERIVELPEELKDYRILGSKIYTANPNSFGIFYISNQIPFDLFPGEYKQYLIYKVAAEASLVLTNNVKLTEYLFSRENKSREEAIADNANRKGYVERVTNKYDRRSQVL